MNEHGAGCPNFGHPQTKSILADDTWSTVPGYLTTREAAVYLRRSVSWLLRQPDIAYIPGKPNLYEKKDLDAWLRKHKVEPRVRV